MNKNFKVALCINKKVEHYNVVKMAIEEEGDNVYIYDKETFYEDFKKDNIDFIVSYGYKHIIKEPLLSKYKNKILNLHPSYLPWGRGYYPNFWSFVEDVPKGISLHFINSGVDTGNILFQREHFFSDDLTLRQSYYNLQTSMLSLFAKSWKKIKNFEFNSIKQNLNEGTSHRERDFLKVYNLLSNGFDTKISEIKLKKDIILETLRS